MKKILLSILLLILMSACSGNNEENNTSDQTDQTNAATELPEVEVEFEHEPIPVNEETTIKAMVTQGDEPVPDAKYVEFEIWSTQDGQDTSETLEAKHVEAGSYEIQYTFEKEGTYQVIAHTQVDDLHTMPQKEVNVGQEGQASGHDHSDNSGKFMVHLMTDQPFKAGENSTLTTHINHMEEPFSDGDVKFEISSDQMDKHIYVDAEESELGEYTATYNFPDPGTYRINIHYEKPEEDIHGHQEQRIDVVQ
ncbi:YtkA-like [Halobacillus dabanensis]|uniref:YtkA-like n=1 Tax=Halobacillus dabanensis TaxID=240302 RepID=A0A1I3XRC0_HALDA|nr:FixH family protein [Halobacillus dabanensis]SFK22197.1 YtkA-like [Halobacillus dabanensis]